MNDRQRRPLGRWLGAFLALAAVASATQAGAGSVPDTVSMEAAADRVSAPELEPAASAAAVTAATHAAILAAELLLAPVCATGQCQDGNGPCKPCAQPVSTGTAPRASDALTILRVAVGQSACAPCVCDVDANGAIVASDALLTLKLAVGQSITVTCPAG